MNSIIKYQIEPKNIKFAVDNLRFYTVNYGRFIFAIILKVAGQC